MMVDLSWINSLYLKYQGKDIQRNSSSIYCHISCMNVNVGILGLLLTKFQQILFSTQSQPIEIYIEERKLLIVSFLDFSMNIFINISSFAFHFQ